MTMPARRASKFCAKRRALSPEVFSQSLIYEAIPGNMEPWPECQPEQLINIHVNKYSRSIYGHIWTYTDIFEHIRTYTNIFNRFQGHPEVVIPPRW